MCVCLLDFLISSSMIAFKKAMSLSTEAKILKNGRASFLSFSAKA